MRLTRQAALAIALVAGLLAALGAWIFIGQQGKTKAPPPVTTVTIPLPVRTIPAWTELQSEMFQNTELKKEQVPVNAVMDVQSLVGRIATADLVEKQPILVTQVAEKNKKLGVAYELGPGVRGMSVSLDVVGAVGDFVQPGNHVDVLSSFQQENQVVVRTLVQDVVVLGIGQSTSVAPPPAEGQEGENAATKRDTAPRRTETPVTLAVTPTQAQVILTADKAGRLRLTLRAMGDRGVLPLPTTNSWSMIGPLPAKQTGGTQSPSVSKATPQPQSGTTQTTAGGTAAGSTATAAPAATAPVRPKKPYVEVIRGDEREYVVPR
jgi:pilus assembly protein CpaB